MSMRHSTHHGLSFLFGILVSVFLSELLRGVLPSVFGFVDRLSLRILKALPSSIDFDVWTSSILLVGLGLAMVYGFFFGRAEKRAQGNDRS